MCSHPYCLFFSFFSLIVAGFENPMYDAEPAPHAVGDSSGYMDVGANAGDEGDGF